MNKNVRKIVAIIENTSRVLKLYSCVALVAVTG